MIWENLYETVLVKPAKDLRDSGSRHINLHIVTAYAWASMANRHMERLRELGISVSICLVSGMPQTGDNNQYEKLHKIAKYNPSFEFTESPRKIHAKVYVWLDGNTPMQAFCGSANYTLAAFDLKGDSETPEGSQIEAMIEIDAAQANSFFIQRTRLQRSYT